MHTVMRRDSRNADRAGLPTHKIQRRYLAHDAEAFDTAVEWHHLAGDLIGFYPSDAGAVERVVQFIAKCHARAAAAKVNSLGIKSKAAAWRYIEKHHDAAVDVGHGSMPVKYGKFGPFVPSFGKADCYYFFQSAEERDILGKWLKIKLETL